MATGAAASERARDRKTSAELETRTTIAATWAQSRSRLHGAAAHELKGALNAMVVNLEMLKQTLSPDAPSDDNTGARRRRYVTVLDEELGRLDRILGELLDQRLPASVQAWDTVELQALLNGLCRLLAPLAKERRVTLECTLGDAPACVHGHAGELQQALLNVLVNAFDAVADGSGRIGLGLAVQTASARIEIEDNGPGIASALAARVFDKHFTTRQTQLGMGLYVTRSIVEAHGGETMLGPAPDAGARVAIELPLESPGA